MSLSVGKQLSERWFFGTGVSYTRLDSEFESAFHKGRIQKQQRIDYLGVPLRFTYAFGAKGASMSTPRAEPPRMAGAHLAEEGLRRSDRLRDAAASSLLCSVSMVGTAGSRRGISPRASLHSLCRTECDALFRNGNSRSHLPNGTSMVGGCPLRHSPHLVMLLHRRSTRFDAAVSVFEGCGAVFRYLFTLLLKNTQRIPCTASTIIYTTDGRFFTICCVLDTRP